ncbi:MAG: hypothetical protein AABY34_01690 [Pseudomonadota bacterium]
MEKLIGKDEKSDRHKEFYKSDCFERNYLAIDISFVVTRGSYREDKQHARALLTFPFKLPGRVLLTGRDVGCCRHTEQTFCYFIQGQNGKDFLLQNLKRKIAEAKWEVHDGKPVKIYAMCIDMDSSLSMCNEGDADWKPSSCARAILDLQDSKGFAGQLAKWLLEKGYKVSGYEQAGADGGFAKKHRKTGLKVITRVSFSTVENRNTYWENKAPGTKQAEEAAEAAAPTITWDKGNPIDANGRILQQYLEPLAIPADQREELLREAGQCRTIIRSGYALSSAGLFSSEKFNPLFPAAVAFLSHDEFIYKELADAIREDNDIIKAVTKEQSLQEIMMILRDPGIDRMRALKIVSSAKDEQYKKYLREAEVVAAGAAVEAIDLGASASGAESAPKP